MLTRRALLSAAAATGLGAALAACSRSGGSGSPVATPTDDAAPTGSAGLQVVGDREQVLAVGDFGMLNFPDGHVTYLTTGTGYRVWVSSGLPDGGGRTVALDTTDFATFAPAERDGADAAAALAPAGGTTALDANYSAPGSVFPTADGTGLWLVYHGENHTFAGVTNQGVPFYATVGLAASTDGGLTWQRRGALVTGQVPRDDGPAPRDVVGAGSPCAVVDGGFAYVFYVDWNLETPDQIHLARAPLARVGEPDAWVKWADGTFGPPADGGASTAVVTRPGDGEQTVFAGNPSVSWNTYLQRWVMVFESADGYWWTTSADLTTWAAAERFLPFDDDAIAGVAFISYPTLLSTSAPDDRETGRDAHLYLAISESADVSHSLWRVPVRFAAP